ncbi:uncharacterized protein N7479_001700 [Penicillium vulpinum]|uniref:uncharacterized protein n=1 Tax=Penicillium vulpinum TaxID=29845 RepID=UPI002548261F|nr:uncharacterized protein N7479_001700 [Penicillium vulpinum]KAJ5971782.1 hypothetical protein N7479_001700 [Penicillium vulpinum]
MDQKFNSMSLDVNSLKVAATRPYQRLPQAPRSYQDQYGPPQNQAYTQGPRPSLSFLQGIFCYFCGAEGHRQSVRECRELAADIQSGRLHYFQSFLHLGKEGDHGPKLVRQDVTDAYEQQDNRDVYDRQDNHAQVPINCLAAHLGSRPDLNEEIDSDDDELPLHQIIEDFNAGAGVNAVGTRGTQDLAQKRRREDHDIASTQSLENSRRPDRSPHTADFTTCRRRLGSDPPICQNA